MLLALHDLVHLEMVSQPKRVTVHKSNHGKDVQLICSHKSSYLGFKNSERKERISMQRNQLRTDEESKEKRYFFLQLGLHQDQQRPPASGTYTSLCLSTVATPFD
ncbi:hypothetical protein AAG906_012831 [Vitis piasezkii]